ncbi:hypothetical protein M3Y99_00476500 [Aphelenchoides fujianensis]|nr:hypothetical protein M3Y99_00476500 [Aphelenchoides fujianensis]
MSSRRPPANPKRDGGQKSPPAAAPPIQRPVVFLADALADSPNAQRLNEWRPLRRAEQTTSGLQTPPSRVLSDRGNVDDESTPRAPAVPQPLDLATSNAFASPTGRSDGTLTPSRFDSATPRAPQRAEDEPLAIIEKLNRDSLEMSAQLNEMRTECRHKPLDFDSPEEFESSFQEKEEEVMVASKCVQTSARHTAPSDPRGHLPAAEVTFESSFYAHYSTAVSRSHRPAASAVEVALRECVDALNLAYKMRLCLTDLHGQREARVTPDLFDERADAQRKGSLVDEFKEQKRLLRQRVRKVAPNEGLIASLRKKTADYKRESNRLLDECRRVEDALADLQKSDQAVQTSARTRPISELLSSSFQSPVQSAVRSSASVRSTEKTAAGSPNESLRSSVRAPSEKPPETPKAEVEKEEQLEHETSVDSSVARDQEEEKEVEEAVEESEHVQEDQFFLIEKDEHSTPPADVPPLDFGSLEAPEEPAEPPVAAEEAEEAKEKPQKAVSLQSGSRKRKADGSIEQVLEPKSGRSTNRDTENDVPSISTDSELPSAVQSATPPTERTEKDAEEASAAEKEADIPPLSPQKTASGFSSLRSDVPLASGLEELPASDGDEHEETPADPKPTQEDDQSKGDASSVESSVRQSSEPQSESVEESVRSTVPLSSSSYVLDETMNESPVNGVHSNGSHTNRSHSQSKIPVRQHRRRSSTGASAARSRSQSVASATHSITELLETTHDLSTPSIASRTFPETKTGTGSPERSGSPLPRYTAQFSLTFCEQIERASLPHTSEEIKERASLRLGEGRPSVEAEGRLAEDLQLLSFRDKTELSLQSPEQETLLDVPFAHYEALLDERERKLHLADRLVRNSMRDIVRFYWHKDLKAILKKGLNSDTLQALTRVEYKYENEKLAHVDEGTEDLFTRLHAFVLERIQFIVNGAILGYAQSHATIAFRGRPTCRTLEELIDTEIATSTFFYASLGGERPIPLPHQLCDRERKTNAHKPERTRMLDHTFLLRKVRKALDEAKKE